MSLSTFKLVFPLGTGNKTFVKNHQRNRALNKCSVENYFWEFGFRCSTSKRWLAVHPRGSTLWSFSVPFVILRIKTPKVAWDKDKGSCAILLNTHIRKGSVIQCQRRCSHIPSSLFRFVNFILLARCLFAFFFLFLSYHKPVHWELCMGLEKNSFTDLIILIRTTVAPRVSSACR